MIKPHEETQTKAYSHWLHVGVFVVLHAGSRISLLASHDSSISDFYLPTAIAVVLINWLPPRFVLPAMYVNAVSTSYLWGNSLEDWPLWFLFGIPETLFPLLSWLFFRKYNGNCCLPDITHLIVFLSFGILIPAIIETFLLQTLLLVTGVESAHTYWQYIKSNVMSEFATTFLLTIPTLYFVTPLLSRKKLIWEKVVEPAYLRRPGARELMEVTSVFLLMFILAFVLDFKKYWYVYGLFSLYFAIRFGFGVAILSNFYIFVITYVIPKFIGVYSQGPIQNVSDSIEILLGANVLFVFAAVTGRVISDVKNVQLQLLANNKMLETTNAELADSNLKLEVANKELDRFAYSVSHDLSAPLKTILGVVNVSKLSNDPAEQKIYLEKIGISAQKLQTFIYEVLDYARNNRQEPRYENIDLRELCTEIIEGLQSVETEKPCKVVFNLTVTNILQDRSRLKIILNNLVSNAFRFQPLHTEHAPEVRISSHQDDSNFEIEITDNGEGIPPEVQLRMFDMFYRGNARSQGSGLGLYIAKSAATNIHGSITCRSEYGKGSAFIVRLPLVPAS